MTIMCFLKNEFTKFGNTWLDSDMRLVKMDKNVYWEDLHRGGSVLYVKNITVCIGRFKRLSCLLYIHGNIPQLLYVVIRKWIHPVWNSYRIRFTIRNVLKSSLNRYFKITANGDRSVSANTSTGRHETVGVLRFSSCYRNRRTDCSEHTPMI